MGEKLQNLKPREAECLLRGQSREAKGLLRGLRGQPREAKPFTRAKWEIRFQRFALSFRLFPSPRRLARRNSVKTGVPMAGRRREPLAFAGALVCGLPCEAKLFTLA